MSAFKRREGGKKKEDEENCSNMVSIWLQLLNPRQHCGPSLGPAEAERQFLLLSVQLPATEQPPLSTPDGSWYESASFLSCVAIFSTQGNLCVIHWTVSKWLSAFNVILYYETFIVWSQELSRGQREPTRCGKWKAPPTQHNLLRDEKYKRNQKNIMIKHKRELVAMFPPVVLYVLVEIHHSYTPSSGERDEKWSKYWNTLHYRRQCLGFECVCRADL